MDGSEQTIATVPSGIASNVGPAGPAGPTGPQGPAGSAGLGALLAHVSYGPASNANYSVSTVALTALDTTNLTIPSPGNFPASGKVIVRASFQWTGSTAAGTSDGAELVVAFINHSGGALVTAREIVASTFTSAGVIATYTGRATYEATLTGTPGAAIPALDMAAVLDNNTGVDSFNINANDGTTGGNINGPAELFVYQG